MYSATKMITYIILCCVVFWLWVCCWGT